MDDTRRRIRRKLDTHAEVLKWLDLGVKTVPISSSSKKPIGGKGWNDLRITAATIPRHFKPGDNIGGLWGKPSDWIVDVDLDWDEAAHIAADILPSTYTYGRTQRPGTHFLFRALDCATNKWRVSKNEGDTIAEVRSTGFQSLLPPSTHEDGGTYSVNHDRPFKIINAGVLHSLVAHIAGLAILARNYPEGGGRHDYAAALCGALLRSNFKPDEAQRYAYAVVHAAGARETDPKQRLRSIDNVLSRYDSSNTYGWPTLDEFVESKIALGLAKKWLTPNVEPVMPAIIKRVDPGKYSIPPHLLEVPGLVGEIAAWAGKRAYVKQPMIDLAAGIMGTAMVTNNRYVVDGWSTPLQPYMIVVAPTAGGKESALNAVYEFCRRMRLGMFCFMGFQSYHSMFDTLAQPPSMACLLWDEAGRKIKSAGKSSGGQDYQIITHFLNLYGKASAHVAGQTARQNTIPAMDFPYLTILAASQPEQLMEAVTEADLATGVVNRMLMFDAGDGVAKSNKTRVDDTVFPSRIEALVKQIRDRPAKVADFPFHRVGFANPKVYEMFATFEETARAHAGGVEGWGRANQNALILAGIVAVGMGGTKPTINEATARWAIDFTTWSVGRWTARIDGASSRSIAEKHSKIIEKFIMNARTYARAGLRPSQIKLLSEGKMPRSLLIRACRLVNARELDAIINQLKQAELIAESDVDGMVIYAAI